GHRRRGDPVRRPAGGRGGHRTPFDLREEERDMIPLPLGRIAEISSGALMGMADPSTIVRGPVVIDSRAAEPGSLFVAIKGQRVDGHNFAPAVVAAGATAVLAARPTEAPTVIVSDVVAALADLAREVCAKLPSATVIGVTGSAG